MNPHINKPMYGDRYGSNSRKNNAKTDEDNLDSRKPFTNLYSAPTVPIEGEGNASLNEHNYYGKNKMNTNNFKEYEDESPRETNKSMMLVVALAAIILVIIIGSTIAFIM